MNKTNCVIRIKSLNIKEGENIGERFKKCREFKNLSQRDINNTNNISRFESGKQSIRIGTLVNYLKALNILKLQIDINKSGEKLEITPFDYKLIFRNLKIKKGKTKNDLNNVKKGTISGFELYNNDCEIVTIINYAKSLGISKLIINIENEQD